MKPILSIITPSYNSEKTIEECIVSVKNINSSEIEHIIVDGASSDTTVEIIKKYLPTYDLKYISEKDSGIADAMNKGFKMAQGDFVAWIDADNYYNSKAFSEIISKIKSNDFDILCGQVDMVDDKKIIKSYKPPFPLNFERSLNHSTGAIPIQPGVFFRKSLFDKVNGFNTQYKIAGDYEFWVKVLKLNPSIQYLDLVFGYYRKEETGASQSLKGIYNGFKEMYGIGKLYKQGLFGKISLILKYSKGYVSVCKQKIVNR